MTTKVSKPKSSSSDLYFPTINMLRGIAALMVCLYHFTNFFSPEGALLAVNDPIRIVGQLGINGVFVFFVISGLVIPISMYKGKYVIGHFHKFIARRWVRIEIPYIASIFAFFVMYYVNCQIHLLDFEIDPLRILNHLSYTIPFTDYDWYNVIFWTLAIEFQFYLFMALVFPLLNHANNFISYSFIGLFGLGSLFVPSHDFLFHYGALFSLGMLLYLYKLGRIQLNGVLAFAILLTVVAAFANSIEIAVFVASTFVVILLFSIDKKWFNKLGDISYSLYLMHGIIGGNLLLLTYKFAETYFAKMTIIILALIISLIGSWVFWKLIEDPSRKLSKKIKL